MESRNFSSTETRWIPGPAQRAGICRLHKWGQSALAGLRITRSPRRQIRRPSLSACAMIPISWRRSAISAGV